MTSEAKHVGLSSLRRGFESRSGRHLFFASQKRGRKTAESMLKGWFVHYNFVRPHQSLNNMTPAEATGINLNLNDGRGDLIELATKYETMKES